METRGATAAYDATADRYLLRSCSQGATSLREQIVAALGVNREQVEVHSEDVGGAFGMKTSVYPEYIALLIAARLTGRPVHWMSDRTEAFLTDNQARDTVTDAELALDAKGRFLALRVKHLAGMGAYIAAAGANIQTMNFARCFPCAYDIPKMSIDVRCVFTNTLPTGPYRGAGRPEANYVMERLVEEAARVSGIDAVTLRRRNLIAPSAMPYKTAIGTVFDSGNFTPILQDALAASAYKDFPKRRKAALREGKLRGIGVSFFLEHAGAMPREGAALSFPGDGTILLGVGVHSTGQGHATTFPRLVAQRLGIPPAQGAAGREPQPRRHCRSRLVVGRLAHDDDRRQRHGRRGRQDAGEGAEDRRQPARSDRGRHRLSRRQLRHRRHGPAPVAVRCGEPRDRTRQGGKDRCGPRHAKRRGHAADISQRLPYRGSRG